ncbi:MAG: HAD family phosphatase [Stomatobaculum sp.]|nr:HAD family phosphatase [Stomatobaculum sp.]
MIYTSQPPKLLDYDKEYKVIALDLDGTLTNSRKEVSPRNIEAIHKAAAKGVHVVLASGRPLPGVIPVAKEVGLFDVGGYMLAYNGSQVVDCRTGESLIHVTLPEEYYPEICRSYRDFGINLLTYDHIGVISENVEKYSELESRVCKIPLQKVPNLLEAIEGPLGKFLATGEYDKLKVYQSYLQETFGDKINAFFSETFFLEIVPPGIEKAASLEKLLALLGCSREQLIACGDSMNDTTMVAYAGLGVAMENAQPSLKSRADYITDTNDNDGVAEVIEKFILHEV